MKLRSVHRILSNLGARQEKLLYIYVSQIHTIIKAELIWWPITTKTVGDKTNILSMFLTLLEKPTGYVYGAPRTYCHQVRDRNLGLRSTPYGMYRNFANCRIGQYSTWLTLWSTVHNLCGLARTKKFTERTVDKPYFPTVFFYRIRLFLWYKGQINGTQLKGLL